MGGREGLRRQGGRGRQLCRSWGKGDRRGWMAVFVRDVLDGSWLGELAVKGGELKGRMKGCCFKPVGLGEKAEREGLRDCFVQ